MNSQLRQIAEILHPRGLAPICMTLAAAQILADYVTNNGEHGHVDCVALDDMDGYVAVIGAARIVDEVLQRVSDDTDGDVGPEAVSTWVLKTVATLALQGAGPVFPSFETNPSLN